MPRPSTKNPALRSAYDRGVAAARSGKPLATCPYRVAPNGCHRRNGGTWGPVFRNYWQRGFFDAKDQEAQTGRLL